ncbi:MAG: HNH endonuclease [Rhizobiales bacterium]|nr:HNH endonuclease [Hyphomicrobiales bacterium]OJU37166.1 MAG: HNH endonuclease [Rhizobiales bacterium 68-8]
MPNRHGDERERSRRRDGAQPWRAWYKTARWQALRWRVLVRDLFTCRMCKRIEADTSRLVADHVAPHRGDERLFWDETNLQCLCKDCHDRVKQADERASIQTRGVWW